MSHHSLNRLKTKLEHIRHRLKNTKKPWEPLGKLGLEEKLVDEVL